MTGTFPSLGFGFVRVAFKPRAGAAPCIAGEVMATLGGARIQLARGRGLMSTGPPAPEAVPGGDGAPLLATNDLLRLAKQGDAQAREQLLSRYIPRLTRWAAGRLPMYARSLLDTADLVQDTLSKVLEGFDRIEVREPGVFQAYVREAMLNRIRDQVRWATRRSGSDEISDELHDRAPSPLENAVFPACFTGGRNAHQLLSP